MFALESGGEQDIYLFTDPVFDTKAECASSTTNPQSALAYGTKLLQEFGYQKPIKSVQCVDKDKILEVIDKIKNGTAI